MKKSLLLTLFTFIFLSCYPGPGDTITIQTFEFEGYPVGEGWLAPREGMFDFTSVEGLEFEKILAYYTLKCDNSQSPACGEWDYLSYLQLFEHTYTGEHPNYKLYGYKSRTPDSYSYMNTVSWTYSPRFEKTITYTEPSNYNEFQIGIGTEQLNYPFTSNQEEQRTFFIWHADELTNSGLSSGNITGIQFDLSSIGSKMNELTIRLKNTDIQEFTDITDTTGFTTVYSKNTEFGATGWQSLDFTSFFNWDGTSNIIVDFYFNAEPGGTVNQLNGTSFAWNCGLISLTDNNIFLSNTDQIHAPVENLAGISNEVSISFWLKGDPKIQPNENSVFEAIDSENNRVLNVHLPWSDQNIYWDAGNETGYDRINKLADNPGMYEGEWHQWVFTKNAVTKFMKVYFDGQLWNTSTATKLKTIGIIDSLIIGKGTWSPDNNYYAGNIDEFQIWDIELSQTDIQNWMYKEIDNTHPFYSNLKLYYKFNESVSHTYYEEISGTYSTSEGVPQPMNFTGQNFKNFQSIQLRPNIKFINHLSSFSVDQNLTVDSTAMGQDMLLLYEQPVPNEKPVLTDIQYVWPMYYNNYVYDENGTALDSTLVTPDNTINKIVYTYYTTDINEEILIPWELGRFITPYGNGLSLGNDGWTWVFDVTKFQSLFQGTDVYLKAGNFQELLDLKFVFIEGTPPRDLIDIEKVWSGNFNLNTFDQIVTSDTLSINPEGEMFELHTCLTGHWFGQGNNCAEFCPNTHSVKVNGVTRYSQQIIQDCGLNPLFPQGGTWFYDRAGWCPGMEGTIKQYDITPFINPGDTEVALDYDIQYDPYGNYVTETFFVTYGNYNFITDAALEEIEAPNTFKLNNRFNPICGNPIIKIKNNGSQPLTSLRIFYGITDQTTYNYDWTGNLAFGEIEEITLPAIPSIEFKNSVTKKFTVNLDLPNGGSDEYTYNNQQTSNFLTAPEYNKQIVIWFYSNKRNWENSYEILDTEGNVVFSRDDFDYFTLHQDTLDLANGCYEFVCYDIGGDGMYNWPSNLGTGYIRFYDIDGNLLTTLEEWFGHEIRHKFVLNQETISIEDTPTEINGIQIYPNPAYRNLYIQFNEGFEGDASVSMINLTGNTIFKKQIYDIGSGNPYKIDVSNLKKGIYFIEITNKGKAYNQKVMIN